MSIRFEKAVPTLGVGSARDAIEYYTKKLGFKMDWDDGVTGHERVMYASLSRGDCQVCISEHPGDQGNPGMWCYVSDARALHDELVEAGADVDKLEAMDWGEIELSVRDLDGNKLCFTQRAPRKS